LSFSVGDLSLFKEVAKLCQTWRTKPKAFLDPWSIAFSSPSAQIQEQSHVRGDHTVVETQVITTPTHELQLHDDPNDRERAKSVLWATVKQLRKSESRRTEDSIRWIMFTISLRDAMVPQSEYRRHLPVRGLIELVARMWRELTDEMLPCQVQEEIVRYVKEGQLYSVIGDCVGEGVWLLLATQTMDKRQELCTGLYEPV
jgi:hypothetical protein